MRSRTRPARRWIWLLACGCWLAGCRPGGPDEARPWALLLSEPGSPEEAAEQAARLAQTTPSLQGTSAVSVRSPVGPTRHLVVSPPFPSREAAEALGQTLLQGQRRRLEVLDFRTLQRAELDPEAEASAPAEAELLEQLAARLPAPGQAELEAFQLLEQPETAVRSGLRLEGWAAPPAWTRALAGLGFRALAQARYRLTPAIEVRVFVALADPARAADTPDALRRVFDFLHEHVRVEAPAEEKAEEQGLKGPKGRKGRKAKIKAKAKRKPAKPEPQPPAVGPDGELVLVPVAPALPPFVRRVLPWGEAEVIELSGVAFVRAPRIGPDTRLRTAWLAWLPERQGVALFLLDDPAAAESWLVPRNLEGMASLQHSPWLQLLWQRLPETSLPGDRLVHLGLLRLNAWLAPALRRLPWAVPLARQPVALAGYLPERGAWQLACAQLAEEGQARALFEQGLIQPRQAWMKAVLDGKQKARFDVGVSLREVGDVEAWLLIGAAEGRAQELYFQRRAEVWLLRGSLGDVQTGSQGLLARAEMLPIWPAAAE